MDKKWICNCKCKHFKDNKVSVIIRDTKDEYTFGSDTFMLGRLVHFKPELLFLVLCFF